MQSIRTGNLNIILFLSYICSVSWPMKSSISSAKIHNLCGNKNFKAQRYLQLRPNWMTVGTVGIQIIELRDQLTGLWGHLDPKSYTDSNWLYISCCKS